MYYLSDNSEFFFISLPISFNETKQTKSATFMVETFL